jgi:hypothetical protein
LLAWDDFNDQYGTIFSSVKWLDLIGAKYLLHAYHKGNELVGGLVDCNSVDVKLTPYHGIIVKDGYEYTVAKEFAKLPNLNLINHYSITDVRPFLWNGYKPVLRHTYIIDKDSKPDKDTRYEIGKAQRNGITVKEGTIDQFWDLYKETFDRKDLDLPVDHQWFKNFDKLFQPRILIAGGSGVVIMSDLHRDYYIFGASRQDALNTGSSSLALSTAITRETDLVGCNNEQVGLFKRGFGGELKVCLGIEPQ